MKSKLRTLLLNRSPGNWLLGLILLCLFLLGGWLRMHNLAGKSVDNDESATWMVIRQSGIPAVITGAANHGQAPLSFVISHAFTVLLGIDEFSMRLGSAIAGTLTILGVYLVGRRLFGHAEGCLAAGLTAVMIQPLAYSQYSRMYAWMVLLATLAVYYWLDLLRSARMGMAPSRRSVGFYILFSVAALYANYVTGFNLAWQAVLLAIAGGRRALKTTAGVYAAIVLGFLPWVPSLLAQVNRGAHSWIPEPDGDKLANFFTWVVSPAGSLKNPGQLHTVFFALYGLALFFALDRALHALFARRWGTKLAAPEALLLIWIGVAPLLLYGVSFVLQPLFLERYLLFTFPAFALLAARGLGGLPRPRHWPPWLARALVGMAGAGLLLFLLHDTVHTRQYFQGRGEASREVVGAIQAIRATQPDAVSAACGRSPQYDFYTTAQDLPSVHDLRVCTLNDYPRLIAFMEERSSQTLILSQVHLKVSPDLHERLLADFCLIDEIPFGPSRVWLYFSRAHPYCESQ